MVAKKETTMNNAGSPRNLDTKPMRDELYASRKLRKKQKREKKEAARVLRGSRSFGPEHNKKAIVKDDAWLLSEHKRKEQEAWDAKATKPKSFKIDKEAAADMERETERRYRMNGGGRPGHGWRNY